MLDLVWLIPALPAGRRSCCSLVRRSASASRGAGWLATADGRRRRSSSPSVVFFALRRPTPERPRTSRRRCFTWIRPARSSVDIGFLADPLSITMVPVRHRRRRADPPVLDRLHARRPEVLASSSSYLNLFVFSMLVLVLGDEPARHVPRAGRASAPARTSSSRSGSSATRPRVAGKKAFVTNRVGDFGFMIAMFLDLRRRSARSTTRRHRRGRAGTLVAVDGHRDRAAAVRRRDAARARSSRSRLAARRDGRPDARCRR